MNNNFFAFRWRAVSFMVFSGRLCILLRRCLDIQNSESQTLESSAKGGSDVRNAAYFAEGWYMHRSMDSKRAGLAEVVGEWNLSARYLLRSALGCVTTTVGADFRPDLSAFGK